MPSLLKKTMVYLGLVDDEYDEYDDYDDRTQSRLQPVARAESRSAEPEEHETRPTPVPVGRIRPLPRENGTVSTGPVAMRPQGVVPRAISPDALTKVHVVAPARFGDAKEIADCLKSSRPVIVNLTVAERDLQRRMIDFCSGVTYALSGEMEKVADQVFLLTPTNVKVSEEERQRLQERNFGGH